MKKLVELFSTSLFLRNVSIVLVGSLLAQLVNIAVLPILARLYSVEAFGVLGVFMALLGILGTIVTGRYNLALVLARYQKETRAIFKLCAYITVSITLLCTILTLLFGRQINQFTNGSGIVDYLIYLPLAVCMLGFRQASEFHYTREKEFKLMAVAAFTATLVSASFRVGYGLLATGDEAPIQTAYGLVFGSLVMLFLESVILFSGQSKFYAKSFETSNRMMKMMAAKYFRFPQYRAPVDLLNSLTQNMPTILLSAMFGVAAAGLYSMAEKLAKVPSQFIGTAVRKVIYQKAAQANSNNKSVLKMLAVVTAGLALVGVIPFGSIILFGPDLFGWLFGEQWIEAGIIGRWISLWMFIGFFNVPAVVAVSVFKLERMFLIFGVVSFVIRIAALIGGSKIGGGVVEGVACYSVASAALNAFLIAKVFFHVSKYDKSQFKTVD